MHHILQKTLSNLSVMIFMFATVGSMPCYAQTTEPHYTFEVIATTAAGGSLLDGGAFGDGNIVGLSESGQILFCVQDTNTLYLGKEALAYVGKVISGQKITSWESPVMDRNGDAIFLITYNQDGDSYSALVKNDHIILQTGQPFRDLGTIQSITYPLLDKQHRYVVTIHCQKTVPGEDYSYTDTVLVDGEPTTAPDLIVGSFGSLPPAFNTNNQIIFDGQKTADGDLLPYGYPNCAINDQGQIFTNEMALMNYSDAMTPAILSKRNDIGDRNSKYYKQRHIYVPFDELLGLKPIGTAGGHPDYDISPDLYGTDAINNHGQIAFYTHYWDNAARLQRDLFGDPKYHYIALILGTPAQDNPVTSPNLNICPNLSAGYDLAYYEDKHAGQLSCCLRDEISRKYTENMNGSDGLWFQQDTPQGHEYLEINSLGKSKFSPEVAMNILKKNIDTVFPGGAKDENAQITTIQLHHTYDISLPKINSLLTVEVDCIDVSRFHFTFEAKPYHFLKGTALHGIFKDACGELWMFQEGRGIDGENPLYQHMAYWGAHRFDMWEDMAANLKKRLSN